MASATEPNSPERALTPEPLPFSMGMFSSPAPPHGPLNPIVTEQSSPTGQVTAPTGPHHAIGNPTGQVTAQTTTSTRPARNTTSEALAKGQKIIAGGTPAPNPCRKCRKGNRDCIINIAVAEGKTCARCAKNKEMCSLKLESNGEWVRRNGTQAAQPCNNCAKKVEQGLPAECFQAARPEDLKKYGTACSCCMMDDMAESCSHRAPRKIRQKKGGA
ncbi:hypothetical protein V8F20_003958 [Naviculisporaceae sp. PSN 640]